jgi:hypothetical protein
VTLHILLHLAAISDWEVDQMDITAAYLNRILKEDIYMQQPRRFENKRFPNHICKLHKSLYRLKQSGKAWHNTLTDFLKLLGYKRSNFNWGLYIRRQRDNVSIILMYMDDLVCISYSKAQNKKMKNEIANQFKTVDKGVIKWFLGLHITQDVRQGLLE